MPNIEIKATYQDLEKARQLCQNLGAKFVGVDRQIDTYFRVPNGRLKLRESSLSDAFLIPYLRPDQAGPKKSSYTRLKVEEIENTKSLLSQMMGIDLVVDKSREIYLIGNVRVHLDKVANIGQFFEFEAVYENDTEEERTAEEKKVYDLMGVFGIRQEHLQKASYQQLAQTSCFPPGKQFQAPLLANRDAMS